MAIYLFKLIRRKIREHQAQKAIPTTNEAHLVPELAPGRGRQKHGNSDLLASTPGHVDSIVTEEAARDKAAARQRAIRQWKLMLGLALPNFLAAVDVTIVAPAIPLISSHFSMLTPLANRFIVIAD